MASGWAHPAGEEEVPSWDDEEAAAHMPDPESEKTKTEKQRQAQMKRESKARVLLTESLCASGVQHPDPSQASAKIRTARRARQGLSSAVVCDARHACSTSE